MGNVLNGLQTTVKKEKLLSISNIFAMTVTFILLGLFIHVIVYTQTALRLLEKQAQITVFFKDEITESKIMEIQNSYKNDERVLDVTYVSKEEAFKIFTDINKNEPKLLENISAQILPASLEIRAKNISTLNTLSEEFGKLDGVEEVKFFKDVIDTFRYWSMVVYLVGFVLLSILLIISYTVIISTLRMTIHARGTELEILKLVGASDQYVKKPLLAQGMFFGGLSALISAVFISALSTYMNFSGIFKEGLSIAFIPGFSLGHLTFALIVSVILIISGTALGYFGSTTAVKKYLKY